MTGDEEKSYLTCGMPPSDVARRFRSVLYVADPMADRKNSRFYFFALSMLFPSKKYSNRSMYFGQSSLLPSNTST